MVYVSEYVLSKVPSVLRVCTPETTKTSHETFSWDAVVSELKIHCPTLFSLLLRCTATFRAPRKNRMAVIGVVCSILCKNRRQSVCMFQRIVSAVLYSGHASKSVSLGILTRMHNFRSRKHKLWSRIHAAPSSLAEVDVAIHQTRTSVFFFYLTEIGPIFKRHPVHAY